jgi:predicted Zn-dependent protease
MVHLEMSMKLFVPLLGFVLLCTKPLQGEDYSTARYAAASAISSGQYNQALKLLAPLLKAHPRDPSPLDSSRSCTGTHGANECEPDEL